MRFSETPISDLSANSSAAIPIKQRPATTTSDGTPTSDGGADRTDGTEVKADESSSNNEARSRASELIRNIGTEFSRLRKQNRSGAWGDLEDKIATSGDILIASGMISSKDWVGMLIDIEQFRKVEGGTAESPGDALAKWLSEGAEEVKAKRPKKAKVQ
jgi:hypothetical protein